MEDVMNNEVIEETTEEIVKAKSGNGKYALVAAGAAVLIGGSIALYKKVVKPAILNAKAKKEKQDEILESEDDEESDDPRDWRNQ